MTNEQCQVRQFMTGSVHQIPSLVMTNFITLQTTNKVVKSSRLRWAGHVVRMDDNELPKRYCGQTLEVNEDLPTEIKTE